MWNPGNNGIFFYKKKRSCEILVTMGFFSTRKRNMVNGNDSATGPQITPVKFEPIKNKVTCKHTYIYPLYMYDKLYRPMDWKQNEPLYSLEWFQFFPVSFVHFMVFNATFNNISATSWRSVLLVEETRVPRENHRPVTSHWQTLSHNVVSSTPRFSGGSNSQC